MVRIYGNVMLSPPQDVNLKQDEANVAGRKKIVYVDASSDTTVPAGSEETITIQPPSGKIWRVITLRIVIHKPDGASSGYHSIRAAIHTIDYVAYTRHAYNSTLYVIGNAPHNDAITTYPETKETWQRAFSALKFSRDYSLHLIYTNSTDADQTYTRGIWILVEEEDEAP